jgi:hypothetical protein
MHRENGDLRWLVACTVVVAKEVNRVRIRSIAKVLALAGFVAAAPALSLNQASAQTTGVYVNGRELSPAVVAQLGPCMPVVPGNYWMDSQTTFGYVGGPALGNVALTCQERRAGHQEHYSDISGGGGLVCDGGSCVGW